MSQPNEPPLALESCRVKVKQWSMLVEWEDDTYDILDQSNIKDEIKLNKDVKSFFKNKLEPEYNLYIYHDYKGIKH